MTVRRALPPLAYVALAVLGWLLLPELPERVPIHWNLAGEPDGWIGARIGALLVPAIGLLTWGIVEAAIALARRLQPEAAQPLCRTTAVVQGALALALSLLHGVTLASALDLPLPLDVGAVGLLSTGGLLGAIGLYLRHEARTPEGWRLVNLPVRHPDHARRILRGTGLWLAGGGGLTALAAAASGGARLALLLAGLVVSTVGLPVYLGFVVLEGRDGEKP